MLTADQNRDEFIKALKDLLKEPRYKLAYSTSLEEPKNTVIESAHGDVVIRERLRTFLKRAA